MGLFNKTAAALVAAVCLYAALTLLGQSFAVYKDSRNNDEPVGTLERRVLQAEQFLPHVASSGNPGIGYLAELSYAGARAREFQLLDVEHIGRYYITQYALAPLRVFPSPAYPLVIAHFLKDTDGAVRARRAQEAGLLLVADVGDGISWYQRK